MKPELASVEAFAEFVFDCGRTTYSFAEAAELSGELRRSISKLRVQLRAYGLEMEARPKEREMRTFSSNPHDRWSAYPSHGGSGMDVDMGIAAWAPATERR